MTTTKSVGIGLIYASILMLGLVMGWMNAWRIC